MEGEVVTLLDVFQFDFRAGVDEDGRYRGTLRRTGLRPRFIDTLADRGVIVPPSLFGAPKALTR
jgi:pilus assembly protein CpaF